MFDKLIGNARVKETLRRMLQSGRVPGALCFAGEDGVGKKLFALEAAKALLCRAAQQEVEACDSCASCVRVGRIAYPPLDDAEANRKILWSEHADVGVVRPAGRFIVVPQMREIERETNFRPFEGARRIFIIEDADRLNEAAANALLKTLEEPPVTSHLILTTARPAALLPTIRSRCQIIRFAPLAPAELETYLVKNRKLSVTDARLLARAAQGSIGRALQIDAKAYRARRDQLLELAQALAPDPNRARLLRIAEEWTDAKNKDDYEARLDALETLLRDIWTLALGASETPLVNEDVRPQLAKVSAQVKSARVALWLQQIETLRGQLSININRKVATDALFLAMAAQK